ncbi:MAG: Na+:H+ antiporter, NhaA family [Actinomycetota bacterium]|nr:Na+:H+ antiporter, NhaA family [Actinomycetota bacterium]
MRRFLRTESASGALLVVGAVVALMWANAAPGSYTDVFDESVRRAIDDWLLPVFFLVVGLEIRRELERPRDAVLPAIAALGGMAVPAVLYVAIGGGRGWAVPTATDLAFAVGVLSLLGPRIPSQLKVFLLTLAVVDDIGSVVVVGAFVGGGIHLTVIAAIVGLAVPPRIGARVEEPLHVLSGYAIVPLFALASAGIRLDGGIDGRVATAVIVARVAGKVAGITGASWLAVRFGRLALPRDTTWPMLAGVGVLGGMGFTVALYVADLSFADATGAKLGVLVSAAVSGALGALVLVRATR